jgi:hypothetical protein
MSRIFHLGVLETAFVSGLAMRTSAKRRLAGLLWDRFLSWLAIDCCPMVFCRRLVRGLMAFSSIKHSIWIDIHSELLLHVHY